MTIFDASQFSEQAKTVTVYAIAETTLIQGEEVMLHADGDTTYARKAQPGELATGEARHTAMQGTTVNVIVARYERRAGE